MLARMGADFGQPTIVEAAWPVVVIDCPSAFADDSVETLAKGFERIFTRREVFAVAVDTSRVQHVPGARWRKAMAAWMNDEGFRAKQARYNAGSATVLRSAPVRGALTALGWLWKPPTPQAYPADLCDAVDWCIARLAEHGVAPSLSLREYRQQLASRVGAIG
jgi:hypothetical protein